MKIPNTNLLSKATVKDPIIDSTASHASKASTTDYASEQQTKFTIRLSKDLMGRIRSAYLAQYKPGAKAQSLSAWAAGILESTVEEIENAHNNGTRFESLPAGHVPRLPLI
ncbi:hypothetical protein [Arcanobacterium hippocoleae]|uniref:Centromere-binding protein ParB C-terminal domain-containing protein n=1 Tax=Arcanobacterium hippocoleae TaxID=149017 RepID=A0ABU1T1F8_9ACTO|nr:hypothetical protein [Arcanobacterium hippocoleae]MDR6939219.1 hypothetical protein [Arcanobacterium hippocoleae]